MRGIAENQRDSASEPDEEDMGDPWLRQFDGTRRVYFWQNFATNEITYDEPEDPLAHQNDLVNRRVKVFWVVQVSILLLYLYIHYCIIFTLFCHLMYVYVINRCARTAGTKAQ